MPQAVGMFPEDEPKEPGAAAEKPGTITSRGSGLSMFPDDEPDRLTDGLRRAPSIGADTAARAFNLQIKTGLPVDLIRRNIDAVEKAAAAQDFDPVEFRARAPKLAGWIEADPNHGALAHDDLVPLTGLESVFNFGASAAGALAGGFFEHANMGAYGVAEAAGDVFGLPELTAWGKKKGAEAKAIGQQFRGEQKGIGRTGKAVLGGLESVGAAAPIMVATVITKNPSLALGLIGVQTAGPAYSEARGEGAGVGTALGYAAIEGAVEVATEKLPLEAIVGDLATGSGLLKTIGHQLLTEIPGEQVATALQDLNAWALLHPEKPFADYLAARPGAFWDTFVSTVVAVGVQTGATRGLDRAVAGDRGKTFSNDLADATKGAKLATRSPEKFEELVAKLAEDSPAKNVLIPVESVTEFYQSQGLDPAKAAEALTGNPHAYAEALQTGADLSVPAGRYALKIAGTDANAYFAEVVRLAPGEFNAKERAEFLEQARTMQPPAESAAATEEPTAAGAVEARITNLLTASGVKPDVADRYARLYGAVYGAGLLERAGLDPVQIFERQGLRFERTTFAEAGLERELAKAAAARKDARPAAGSATAESDVPRGTAAEGETGSPAGLPPGLEDVEGLADVLAGLGGAELTEAPTGSEEGNASGESAASLEALRRGEGMAARGETFVVYDRAGKERVLLGPEAVDYVARPGETYGVRTATGFELREDRGGKVPSAVSSPRGAQTGARPGDADGERGRSDADRRPEAASDGGDTQRRRLPTVLELAERDGDTPFEPASAEADATRFTPEHVRELERIAEELEQLGFEGRAWTFTDYRSDKTGGSYEIAAGGAGSPVLDDVLEFAPLSKSTKTGSAAKQVRGTRAQIAKAVRAALESRRIKTNLVEGAMRVAERRAADDYREISRPSLPPTWGEPVSRAFVDELSTMVNEQIETLGLDAAAIEGVGDPTFDPTEFEQRDRQQIDLLDTGEEQPRLPGAEDVRDQDIATPTFEAPFALTSEVAKPERGKRAAPAPSPAYTAALEASRVASQAFGNAQRQYRAGEISDAQFLEARAANEAATAAFDEAFAKEEALAAQRGRSTLFATRPTLEAQGVISFGADRKFTIKLFEKANLSTVLHESGHLWLELMADTVATLEAIPAEQRTPAQNGVLADFGALLPWLGDAAGGEVVPASRFTRQQHEKFARGFEAYLLEGHPPSEALRPAFQKFKQWLTEIYKNLLGLERAAGERLDLTPEVRGVFDRLLASDAQIAQVRQQQIPIFTTAADAGMGEAEFALYRGQIEKANLRTQDELDQKLMADVRRQRTAAYKAQRDAVESAVVEELNAAPVYKALAAMRTGTKPDGSSVVEGEPAVPLKLSRTMLVAQIGEARTKALPRPVIYSSEGGIDPQLAAEWFGFDSVDRMCNEIEAALPYAQVVQGETDRRMVAQYGDLLLDGGLADARKAASANEERETVIRAELRALQALRRQVGPFARQAATAARTEERAERDYERAWFEAEAKLRIAIAEGRKQVEIDRLTKDVARLKNKTRGAAPAIRRGLPNATLLRDAARAKIGASTIEHIRPNVWFEAARRNGMRAQEAAARQDLDAAIDFKTQELFSLALYREATQVLEVLERRVGKARDLAKPAARARLGIAGDTYLDQIDGILDRLEFAKVSAKALERRASIAKFVAALEGQGLPVELPDEILDDARRTNYRKLTVDELTGVLDGIDQILHLSRLKNRLLKSKAKRDLDEQAGELAASIRAKTKATKRGVARDRRPTDERMRTIDGYFASQTKLSTIIADLDGFEEGGPMWEAVGRAVNESGDQEALETEQATKALHALVEAAFPGRAKFTLYEKVAIPAVGRSLSRMERIMVAMNYGNEGNKERILEGEGWTEAQAQAVIDSLEKRDLEFVQGVFDYFETFRPAIAAKQKRITGLEPTWVEATPIQTRHGEYRGGYFPIKADDRLTASAAAKLDLDAANLAKLAAFTRPTTKRGHLKERKGGTEPVRLDFGTIFEHTTQVIHDLTHHEMLIDVGRILGHRDVQAAIYETKGDQVYKDLKAHLRDIALGDIPAQDGFERGLAHARTGATVVGLGWSLTTPLYQPLGLTVAWRQIGGKWVAKGIGRWMRDTASMTSTVSWVHERSTFMRLRHKTMQREINEIRNSIGVETGRFSAAVDQAFQWGTFGLADKQAIADSYFFLIGRAQMIADVPTWIGAYEKAMATGKDDATAVALADQAVLDTQGGGQIKDLAPVQKGSAAKKLWTNFYSAFNVFYNQAVRAQRATNLRNPVEIGRLAADYFLIYIAPATLTFALPELAHALMGGGDEDDDESFWAGLVRANLSYVMGSMIGLRELSSAVQGYAGYEGPAGARGFAAAARLVKQTDQWVSAGFDAEKLDAAFWRSLADTAGVWLHFPAGQVRRTIEGTAALIEGKSQDPTDVVTGPAR